MDILTNLNLELRCKLNDEGKNSCVYVMKDKQLNTDLVVKCVSKNDFTGADEYFNEAAILYEVQHTNIVKIQHATEDVENVYFSMPYYKNGSINALMKKKFLSVREIIQFSLDFLNGLHYVHTKGLIHFDIKPTNILISDNGKALLTDFGLSKYTNSKGLSYPDKIYPIHIPPEMIEGNLMSKKADIYQVGMTLYRMCNGNENFKMQLKKYPSQDKFINDVLKGKFPDMKCFLPHIPKKLRKVIKTALKPNPDDRYNTVLDMINDLSIIDKNLNVLYYQDRNTRSDIWEYPSSSTHKNCIVLKQNGNYWDIQGEKVRLLDNSKSFIHDFCSKGHPSKKVALKQIENIFNNI